MQESGIGERGSLFLRWGENWGDSMHAVSDATPVYYGVPSHHRVTPTVYRKGALTPP